MACSSQLFTNIGKTQNPDNSWTLCTLLIDALALGFLIPLCLSLKHNSLLFAAKVTLLLAHTPQMMKTNLANSVFVQHVNDNSIPCSNLGSKPFH